MAAKGTAYSRGSQASVLNDICKSECAFRPFTTNRGYAFVISQDAIQVSRDNPYTLRIRKTDAETPSEILGNESLNRLWTIDSRNNFEFEIRTLGSSLADERFFELDGLDALNFESPESAYALAICLVMGWSMKDTGSIGDVVAWINAFHPHYVFESGNPRLFMASDAWDQLFRDSMPDHPDDRYDAVRDSITNLLHLSVLMGEDPTITNERSFRAFLEEAPESAG